MESMDLSTPTSQSTSLLPRRRQLDESPPALEETSSLSQRVLLLEVLVLGCSLLAMGYFLSPILGVASLNPDSGTALSVSLAFSRGNADALINELFPPMEIATYAALFRLGWIEHANVVPVLSSFLFALTLSAIVLDHTRKPILAAVPPFLLLFSHIFWLQAGILTFYPAFALFGTAGAYVGGKYVLRESSERRLAVLAGLLLAAGLYAFTTALLFLPIPALLLLCYWSRRRAGRTVHVYLSTALFSGPWFIWHLVMGGTHFYYHPLNWLVQKYLPYINREFWQLPHDSLIEYAPKMLSVGFSDLLAAPVWGLVAVGLVHVWLKYGWRAGMFTLLVSAFFLASLAVVRPAPYGRYFYPILSFTVLMGTAGVAYFYEFAVRVEERVGVAAMATVAILVVAVVTPATVASAHFGYVARLDSSPGYREMTQIAQIIDDSRGVISRDSVLQPLIPQNQIRTVFLLGEAEYVTYLKWPSDTAVLNVLKEHDIGWVLLYQEFLDDRFDWPSLTPNRWEGDYNLWLEDAYGIAPRHYQQIRDSDRFELVYHGRVYSLYKVTQPRSGKGAD